MADVIMGTTRSRTRITPEGTFEGYYETEFFIDDARYTIELPAEGWTAKAAEEAVKKRAAELLSVRNKKVTMP